MRVSPPILALAALAALGACNRVHPAAAKIAIPAGATAPAPPAWPQTTPGPQTASASQTAAATQTAGVAQAGAGPQTTGGLWRQRVTGPQGVSVTRYCLDTAAAGSLAQVNQQLSGHCSQHQMALEADGAWHFKTACDTPLGSVTTEGTMRGDFARHYVVQASQQGVHGMTHMTADVQRLGVCPSGMKAGDVILPDGSHSRVGALPGNA